MQSVIAGLAARASLQQRHEVAGEADRRKLAALRMQALGAHARAVMEARAEVLASIEGYAISHGRQRAWGIAGFLEAQEAWAERQEIERRRDAGEILTDREAASLAQKLMLTAADGFHLDPGRIRKANDRRKKGAVCRSAIYEWFKARDSGSIVALAPVPPKVAEPIPAAFGDFLKFYAKGAKPTVSDAYAQYVDAASKAEGVRLMTLTEAQVRYILCKRLDNIERHVGREGLLTLRKRMAYVSRTTEDMWPTTLYTADGKTFDAEIADPVTQRAIRPEITSVLDVATRKCVGYAVSRKENVIAVTEALRRSCSAHGICAIFYTDRGAGYKNKTFDADVGGLMGRLGITKMHALPYNSQAKGIIERFNAVWNTLAKRLPTYIGHDMDKEEKLRVHKETRRELAEFGRARRLPSWDEFIALIEREIEGYNSRPHRGLPTFDDPQTGKRRHMSPNEAWAAHLEAGFEPVRIDPEDEDDLFRPYEIRTARRGLVEWNTNTFFHPDLEAYHEAQVMVGYDLHQADKVWVREYDGECGQPGKLICIATYSGNKHRYIPYTSERAAVEQRARGQLRRLGRKVEAVEEQLQAPMLEASPAATFIEPVPDPAPAPSAAPLAGPAELRRRTFASDEELAAWALRHPQELTGSQAGVLRDCLARPAARELFRLSGIDVEALRNLLRAAA